MTTNEKIAKWLGLNVDMNLKGEVFAKLEYGNSTEYELIDFLHDRNQQKWIIDELVKRGYTIAVVTDKEGTNVTIYREKECPDGIMYDYNETTSDKSEGSALVRGVLELITKEETK